MSLDPQVVLTILGMAVVTYFTRATGLWLMGRITLSRRMEAGLSYVPGAVLMAIVAPVVLDGGIAEKVAALVTALVAFRTKSLFAAMIAGVGAVLVMRHL